MSTNSQKELVRSLKLPVEGVDFTSNDYLGFARSEQLFERIQLRYASSLPHRNGSTGSRLLSGNTALLEQTESELAAFFRCEAALVFDSGYSANLAVLSALPQRGDTIIMDELSHASLKDGARLSLATQWKFAHNDLSDLESKLRQAKGERWIVAESLYSMDGDVCPIVAMSQLARRYDARLIIDEAHTTGLIGTDGSGYSIEQDAHHHIDLRVHTFGKAMGVHGACVATTKANKDLLINFARPFIYTTAPSGHSVVSIACAFDYLKENLHLLDLLRERIRTFIDGACDVRGWNGSSSQIQAVLIQGNDAVIAAGRRLQDLGFDVRPILSPTVPIGKERLRICLHTFNAADEIQQLTSALKSIGG